MGNCCGWCARCCGCCCCSRCCKRDIEVQHKQLVAEEEPVVTVTEDPSGDAETQEIKVVVAVPDAEQSGTHLQGDTGSGGETKERSSPPSFVRGGTGRGSWRVVPTTAVAKEAPQTPEPEPTTAEAEATDGVQMSFEEPAPTQHQPRNIVLFAHEVEEDTVPPEVVQSFSFSTTKGTLTDH